MPEDVKIPLAGGTKKKYLIIAGGVAAVYVAYRWYANSASGAATTDTTGSTTAADTGMDSGVSTDTSTGLPVSGNVQYAGSTTDTTDGTTPTTNAQWTQYAVSLMTGVGVDSGAASSALGKYLGRQAVTSTEQNLIQQAIALAGPPPVGTYTIIHTVGSPAPSAPVVPDGVHISTVSPTSFYIMWNAHVADKHYLVYEGSKLIATHEGTYHHVTGRKAGTKYGPFTVVGENAAGKKSAHSKSVYVTTPKK